MIFIFSSTARGFGNTIFIYLLPNHIPDEPHSLYPLLSVDPSWNVMTHGDAREGTWRGNWRMQWVANTLHTTSEHVVSSITIADAHTSAASSRLNWRPPADLNGLVRFAERQKSGYCACAHHISNGVYHQLIVMHLFHTLIQLFNTCDMCQVTFLLDIQGLTYNASDVCNKWFLNGSLWQWLEFQYLVLLGCLLGSRPVLGNRTRTF